MLELLYEALRSEHGIIIEEPSGNVERLRQKLYALRKEDPDLACIALVVSPTNPNYELWLLKTEVKE